MKKLIIVLFLMFITGCSNNKIELKDNYYLIKENGNIYLYNNLEKDKMVLDVSIDSYLFLDNKYIFRCLDKSNNINIVYYILEVDNKKILGPYNGINELDVIVPNIDNNKWINAVDLYK
ncbi:MAG: hypothetical protein PHQ64_02730 [Bacilli bacterium]|nr:hypothetical protein [Bacilli bacterium]